ncbi:hypothetical protein C8R43DRAFT_1018092 [Mycena crocata]|nr:hypothetical protein C8R43DRAFT_1018092 [Mycena crocata]
MRMYIPSDVWRYIAGFIPADLLVNLYSVNRTFLEIATEVRYQAINFVAYDTTKLLIKHVKDCKLVHSVHIQPWQVQAKKPKPSSWSFSTWKLINACVAPTYAFEEDSEAQILRRLRKQSKRIADTVKGLPNLHTYHIDWDEGPTQLYFFSALLDCIPVIGYKLSTLILKVPLHHMPSLPLLAAYLPILECVALTLHTGTYAPIYISEKMEGLIVFLHALMRNLRSLTLHTTPTSAYLDLSWLFRHLGHGRHLTSFTLCIPFDGGHLADTDALRHFIFKHRFTLESLTLRTTRAGARPVPGAPTAKFWIRDTLKNQPLPVLSSLSLGLRPLRTDLGPLLRYLTGMRSQLRVLKLAERPLEFVELARILDVLDRAPLLRVLSLRMRWLSPEVIDLLAMRLPALNALDLSFTEVVHQEPTSDASSTLSEDSSGFTRESELTFFCQSLHAVQYSEWKLTCLSVPESPRGQRSWLEALEQAFVGCIPSLTSFGELVLPG